MPQEFRLKKIIPPIALAVVLLMAILGWQIFIRQYTLPSLSVAGLKIGNLKIAVAKEILQNQLNNFNARKITLTYQDNTWQFTPMELGLQINSEQTLAQLDWSKQTTNWLNATGEWLQALFSEQKLPLVYSLDSPKFNRLITDLSIIEEQPENASLKYNFQTDDFDILPPKNGRLVNQAELLTDVLGNFTLSQSIQLELVEAKPSLGEDSLMPIKQNAKNLINQAPYFLDSVWRIEKQELADWMLTVPASVNPQKAEISLDQNKISNFLASLTPLINREPTNGKLSWENNELKFAVLAQEGKKLNIERSAEKIKTGILAGQKNITLAIDIIEPTIGRKNIEELGIVSLLGTGESDFKGSPQNRKHNLTLGAQKLNGLLIKTGEEFSFSQRIGNIDSQEGYLPELVIKQNKTIPELGGGMCQVSTTLFRAAFNSGLKITERHPHAYPVRYYNPPGFDATVYPPSPDLKFVNDTPNNILLQSKIENTKLIFEIYGTNDGRDVKMKGPTITQKNPDGSLKTVLAQEIWRGGQLERSDIFRSSYQSPNLFPVATSTSTR